MNGNTLLEPVRQACSRLATNGWADRFASHGLDITATNLEAELARELTSIDRKQPGFEDFCGSGRRAIEPGRPAQSLLYHGLASPRVRDLADYPTLAELDELENYIFGVDPPSIEDLRARTNGAPLAIVVFAVEYRPAADTPHRRHADMCFSRTGVARVGTAESHYDGANRSYAPEVDGDPRRVRVLPCRYSAYVAALRPGDAEVPIPLGYDAARDGARRFWVPLHKIFRGMCLRGKSIDVTLSASHVNDKLRRVHLYFLSHGHDAGWRGQVLGEEPFVQTTGLAAPEGTLSGGSYLVSPLPRAHLIEPAIIGDQPLTFIVPQSTGASAGWSLYSSSLALTAQPNGGRTAPEYIHVRHRVTDDGAIENLNELADMLDVIRAGGYRAQHYLDATADGWVAVHCGELGVEFPRQLAAYSVITAPDFFPYVKQTDLTAWTDTAIAPAMAQHLWPANPGRPEALSDQRLAANIERHDAHFDIADDTVTALVGLYPGPPDGPTTHIDHDIARVSTLSDAAAGIFAPGWDIGVDRTPETERDDSGHDPGRGFLAVYGLGSPFPEDAKLCAALSSFWPAVAPDITRTFAPSKKYASASPLTDDLIGMTNTPPWDGQRGPAATGNPAVWIYPELDYADYTDAALKDQFTFSPIGRTTREDYIACTLTTVRAYELLGAATTEQKVAWTLISFHLAAVDDTELLEAMQICDVSMQPSQTYRFQFGREPARCGDGVGRTRVTFTEVIVAYADPLTAIRRTQAGMWVTDALDS